MQLPIQTTQIQDLSLMQTKWSSILNPLLANPTSQGLLLKKVSLTSGTNVINHNLGRNLVGWFPARIRSSVVIYDNQDNNQYANLTLILEASAAAVVDLYVF